MRGSHIVQIWRCSCFCAIYESHFIQSRAGGWWTSMSSELVSGQDNIQTYRTHSKPRYKANHVNTKELVYKCMQHVLRHDEVNSSSCKMCIMRKKTINSSKEICPDGGIISLSHCEHIYKQKYCGICTEIQLCPEVQTGMHRLCGHIEICVD